MWIWQQLYVENPLGTSWEGRSLWRRHQLSFGVFHLQPCRRGETQTCEPWRALTEMQWEPQGSVCSQAPVGGNGNTSDFSRVRWYWQRPRKRKAGRYWPSLMWLIELLFAVFCNLLTLCPHPLPCDFAGLPTVEYVSLPADISLAFGQWNVGGCDVIRIINAWLYVPPTLRTWRVREMINQTWSQLTASNEALPAEPSLCQWDRSQLIDSRARNKCLLFKPLNFGEICYMLSCSSGWLIYHATHL